MVADMEMQPLIRQMTNWQRTQWARAGYPQERVKIERFLAMRHGALEDVTKHVPTFRKLPHSARPGRRV